MDTNMQQAIQLRETFLHKDSVRKWRSSLRANFDKEDGNVESALVLIPLLMLFLIGVQIIVGMNIRNAQMALAQGEASATAISHQYRAGDEVIQIGGRIEKIQVLVTHRARTLPQIVPGLAALMGGNPTADVVGIAVIEPSNS
jgi:hypothetical protein